MSNVADFPGPGYPSKRRDSIGGGGFDGGDMIEQRVANLERDVGQMKADIATIKAELPHLATKDDIADIKTILAAINASLPHLATKRKCDGYYCIFAAPGYNRTGN